MAYDKIKNGISAAIMLLKNNPEQVQSLLNVQSMALDMQAEIMTLRLENEQLKSTKDREAKVVRHRYKGFITFSDDKHEIEYCVVCWEDGRKMISMVPFSDAVGSPPRRIKCSSCNNRSEK